MGYNSHHEMNALCFVKQCLTYNFSWITEFIFQSRYADSRSKAATQLSAVHLEEFKNVSAIANVVMSDLNKDIFISTLKYNWILTLWNIL